MTHGQTAIGMKIGLVLVLLLGLASPAIAQVCTPPPEGLIGWWTGDVDGTDRSINGNDALLQNGASAGVAGKVDGAFSFDGQDDIANAPLILPSIGTLDLWVNPTAFDGGIHSFMGAFGVNGDDRLQISVASTPMLLLVNLGSNSIDDFILPSPLIVGKWTHLALTFDYIADTYTLYVNGALLLTVTPSRNAPTGNVQFGAVTGADPLSFNGLIDEVEVFDRVLDSGEIQAIFDAGSAGKCKGPTFFDFTLKKAEITFDKKGGIKDQFKIEGKFTLGPDNDGLNLVTDEVVIGVGTGMVTIPAGSFMAVGSQYKFDGMLSGVKVKMTIKEIGFDQFLFKAEAKGIDLTDTGNPVDIILRIGNDVGEASPRLGGTLRLPNDHGKWQRVFEKLQKKWPKH